MIKRALFIKAMLLCLILAGCGEDVSYPLADGGSHSFKNGQGKLTLINYWAIWCTPCREEIPELNKLAEEYADQLTVLGVNFDNTQGEKLSTQVEKLGIEFSSLQSDPRALWSLNPVSVLPETLVIDSDGVLLHRLIGPQTLESLIGIVIPVKAGVQ
jgi:thiol-disulfide isomerase/thioredoxin